MNSALHSLYSPFHLGALTLANRMVMAPLTRNRANSQNEPTELTMRYYAQRASAGLIITEATQICPAGQGYVATPGIHSAGQIAAWKKVVDVVHQAGGKICLQLWHVGRISHVSLQPNQAAPVAPSALRANAKTVTAAGFVDVSEPRALSLSEIDELVETYAQAARNAQAAGFDMVEIHAANGYLIDQFLRDKTNLRQDEYGGSIENRARFLQRIVDAICQVYEPGRVGCRISPENEFNDIADCAPQALFLHVAQLLGRQKLGYLHIVQGQMGADHLTGVVDYAQLSDAFKQAGGDAIMLNNGYTQAQAEAAIDTGAAALISFGKAFIANPDLVARFIHHYPLNEPDQSTFYGGDARGYTDYPCYQPQAAL